MYFINALYILLLYWLFFHYSTRQMTSSPAGGSDLLVWFQVSVYDAIIMNVLQR